MTGNRDHWLDTLAIYVSPKLLIVFALGFSSGLPLALTGSTLSAWMTDAGVDLKTIGLFALVGSPYAFKPLWAPFIDQIRLPFLHKRFGRRRSWLLLSQLLLIGSIIILGSVGTSDGLLIIAGAAVLVAFCSATQDVIIDAFRVEYLDEREYAAGAANYVAAYRVAMLMTMAGAFYVVDFFEAFTSTNAAWSMTYLCMAALGFVGVGATLMAKEPELTVSQETPKDIGTGIKQSIVDPFLDFAHKPAWISILIFIVLYKFADAYADAIRSPFVLRHLGFDRTVLGNIVNGYGLIAGLAGGFLGGYLQANLSLVRALWLGGIVMMLSNLSFVWLSIAGHDMNVLVAAVTIENFTGGIGTTIFVAFLSMICTNVRYTATQFALLTALASLGRVYLTANAGYVAEGIGWTGFFLFTTAAALPGLGFLWYLTRTGVIDTLENARKT